MHCDFQKLPQVLPYPFTEWEWWLQHEFPEHLLWASSDSVSERQQWTQETMIRLHLSFQSSVTRFQLHNESDIIWETRISMEIEERVWWPSTLYWPFQNTRLVWLGGAQPLAFHKGHWSHELDFLSFSYIHFLTIATLDTQEVAKASCHVFLEFQTTRESHLCAVSKTQGLSEVLLYCYFTFFLHD